MKWMEGKPMTSILHSKPILATGIGLFFFWFSVCAQISFVPPSYNYTSNTYNAGNQNWSVAQAQDGIIYIANNDGLLSFDGVNWKLHKMPNNLGVKSIFIDSSTTNEKIYVGSYEEFGYFEKDSFNQLTYNTLIPLVKNYNFMNDEIWTINKYQGRIFFQSFSSYFIYHPDKEVKPFKPIPGPLYFFSTRDNLYAQFIESDFCRFTEGAGEDPYLGSKVAEARVKGFQGGSDWQSLSSTTTLLACGKHLAAYGAAESGRDYNTAELSEHTLRNVYLPPYEAALKAGVGTFMASFNEINGVPATADKWLMTDILRNEWGFKGFVVSDYTGINELVPHGVAKDEKHAAQLAVNAGVDMDMTGSTFIKYLEESVKEEKVSEQNIDNAVRSILEMKFLLGLFDDPYRYLNENRAQQNTMTTEFMETARKTVAASVVLLKNENILPISKESGKTIALIGPLMNDSVNLNGEWAGLGDRNKSVPIFKGLTDKYKNSSVKLIYAQGSTITETSAKQINEAVSAAKRADIVIAAMGEDFNWSGEAAVRTDIRLPEAQRELLKALKETGKPIVLVSLSGRPLDLSWEDENLHAILQAWFPGTQAGPGIADVIAGDYNPSGRLAMSFPRNVGQIPIYYNQKNTGRPVDLSDEKVDYKSHYLDTSITPLYPFGYGLSYTTFSISNVSTDKSQMKTDKDKMTVTAKVRNTGSIDGELVVQLYTRQLWASVTRPVKELKGFQKVALKAGESKQISFELTSEDLAFFGIDMKKKTEPGDFKLWIAQSSDDQSNEISFSVTE